MTQQYVAAGETFICFLLALSGRDRHLFLLLLSCIFIHTCDIYLLEQQLPQQNSTLIESCRTDISVATFVIHCLLLLQPIFILRHIMLTAKRKKQKKQSEQGKEHQHENSKYSGYFLFLVIFIALHLAVISMLQFSTDSNNNEQEMVILRMMAEQHGNTNTHAAVTCARVAAVGPIKVNVWYFKHLLRLSFIEMKPFGILYFLIGYIMPAVSCFKRNTTFSILLLASVGCFLALKVYGEGDAVMNTYWTWINGIMFHTYAWVVQEKVKTE